MKLTSSTAGRTVRQMPDISTFLQGHAAQPSILVDTAAVIAFCRDLCDWAEAAHTVAPLRVTRRVADTNFEIATTMADHAALCVERLGHTGKARSDAAPVRLVIASAGELGFAQTPMVGRGVSSMQALEEALVSTPFSAHHHPETRFWQVWDRDRRIGVQLQAAPGTLPAWEAGSPLRNLVKWALSTADVGLLHAGTLAVDGRGFLFAGKGGAGKSGTVISGLRGGLESVGDDYVLARLTPDSVRVMPVFQTLKCDMAGLKRLGLLERDGLVSGKANWQGKYEFTFAQLTGAPAAPALRIDGLCATVLAHTPSTRFEPISHREAFIALAPTGVAQLPSDRGAHFSLCARISRALPCFRLHLGTDPVEVASAIRFQITKVSPTC